MNIEFILNDALNKALITDRIKGAPNSNKIADFVSKYVEKNSFYCIDKTEYFLEKCNKQCNSCSEIDRDYRTTKMEIENIKVKVTYEVGLGGLTLNEKEFKQLEQLFESDRELDGMGHDELNTAREWLNTQIKESDCYSIKYEIQDLT